MSRRHLAQLAFVIALTKLGIAQSVLHHAIVAGPDAGTSIAPIGDVNGDGKPDYVVGAPAALSGGSAFIVSGATGAILRILTGAGGEFGASVARVADLDADGIADVLIGAPTGTSSGSAAGEARILSSATGALLRLVLPTVGPFGAVAVRFGHITTGLGELTSDVVSEYLVASQGDRGVCVVVPPALSCPCAPLYAGTASVYSGATGTTLRAVTMPSGERFASSASSVGDLNADGVADYILATNGNLAGNTYCCGFFPCSTFPYHSAGFAVVSGATGTALWSVYGQPASVNAAVVGDVNADGNPDIVGTFVALIPGTTDLANAFLGVYSGATGLELGSRYEAYVIGTAGSFDIQSTIANVGDANGDGVSDFVVGSPARGLVRLYSGSNFSTLWTLSGAPGDRFGATLAAVGDLNNDGTLDLAIGSPGIGAVQVISPRLGMSARVESLGTICANGSTSPLLGSSLAQLGTTARIVVSDAPPTVFAPVALYLFMGTQPASPMFVNAGTGFATPCELHVDPFTALQVATTSAVGRPWITDVPVPNDPALNGVVVNLQAVAIVTNQFSGLPAGAGLSNGLRITVGQ